MTTEKMQLPEVKAAAVTSAAAIHPEWVIDPADIRRLLPDDKVIIATAHTLRYLALDAKSQSQGLLARAEMLEAKAALFAK